MPINLSRRELVGGVSLFGLTWLAQSLWTRFLPLIPSRWAPHAGATLGHRVRTEDFPKPSSTSKRDVVIVGGGISGLSAARFLRQHGLSDFELLELESRTGGNAIWGENSSSRYPWGAHYLPIPRLNNVALLEFLTEVGAITGWRGGKPVYNELYLCHDPAERIFDGQQWSGGLWPERLMSEEDHAEVARFEALMESFTAQVGRDGRLAFTIPVDESSRDPEFLKFDRLSMQEFLNQHGFRSEVLRWYVEYGMRDDFGTPLDKVSAWAGIHYFAARGGEAANAPRESILTWPQGNGWLAERLRVRTSEHIRSGELVYRVESLDRGARVYAFDAEKKTSRVVECDHVIYAAPRVTAFHVVHGYADRHADLRAQFQYSPWVVANVTVNDAPSGRGAPLSWDNVRYQSPLLGYVLANHQEITRAPGGRKVLTVYWPLTEREPRESREWARARALSDWTRDVVAELEQMHPGISSGIESVRVKVWGHAMIQPRVGFISDVRDKAREDFDRVIFAHTDMSGISIFEEGFERGRQAALRVKQRLG